MKKILAMTVLVLLGVGLATPVLADHDGYYRGHSSRVVRRGYYSGYYTPRPRFRSSISFGFGLPFFGYGVYAPPPPPYYYQPAPVVLAPGYCHPYWVPGHYVYGGDAGIWVAGYWAR